MTNEELIAKIKAEIERRIDILSKVSVEEAKKGNFDMSHYYHGKDVALEELLSFLSTIESEKPIEQDEDLNEEIKKFIDEYGYERGADKLLIAIVARHFAQWQKEQDEKELSDLLTIAHLQGADQMKEQMLKETVEVIVEDWNPDPEPEITIPLNPEEFTRGDKVRIIIVKEDEK